MVENFFLWLMGLILCVVAHPVVGWIPLWIWIIVALLFLTIDFISFYRKEQDKKKKLEQLEQEKNKQLHKKQSKNLIKIKIMRKVYRIKSYLKKQ